MIVSVLICLSVANGQKKEPAPVPPQQGVELLFPAGTGKHAKGAKLSKEEKLANALLKKLKAIEKGGNVNAADKRGQTALMHAAAANNRLAVCWLIAKGANATIKSLKGEKAAELTKDKSLQAFLEACCVDRRSLSDKEKKELQDAGFTKENTYGTENVDRDEGEELKLATQLLRLGCKEENLHHFGYPSSDPLYATLFSRHGYELNKAGEEMDWQKPEVLRLLLALGIKMGKGDALSQAKVAMLLDDAQTLHKIVEEHPDFATNRGLASKIVAYLGAPETLQVLIDAGLDPKVSWNGSYKDSKDCFIEDILTGPRRSAAGIRALAAAGAPLPVHSERRNVLTADMGDHSYDPEVIDALIDAGADVNAIGSGKRDQRGTFSGLPPLVLAAMQYGEQAVSHLLSKGAQINARWVAPRTPFDGRTALYSAIIQGCPEVVRLLLRKGADTKAIPEGGKSVLKLAVSSGNYDKIKALLDHGVPMEDDVLQSLPSDTNKPSADEIEKLAFSLLEHGAKVQSVDAKNGYTPLMSLGWLSERIAKRLLDDGADPNAIAEEDGVKLCALGLTLQRGRSDIAKYLQQRGAKMVGDLLLAKPEDMRAMLEAGASVPEDLFKKMNFSAIGSHGNPTAGHAPELTLEELTEAAKILRDAGAKPTMRCMYNYNLGDAGIPALLAAGADPNEKNERDEYFFFQNITSPTITPLFLKAGVNVNLQDKKGNTALLCVCQEYRKWGHQFFQKVLILLLNAGADPNIKNKEGKTALQYAQENEAADEFVKLLKEHGAKEEKSDLPNDKKSDPNAKDKEGRTPLMQAALDPDGLSRLKECIAQKGDVNARDNKGCTALRLLFGQDGDINDRVQELLNAKADVNLGDSTDFTPLMVAACYKDTAKRRFRVQRLINAKVNVNAAGKAGNTAAMHLLLHYDDPDTLRMLLDAGAKPDHKNGEGKTMLDIASENHRNACIKLLNEHFPASAPGHQ